MRACVYTHTLTHMRCCADDPPLLMHVPSPTKTHSLTALPRSFLTSVWARGGGWNKARRIGHRKKRTRCRLARVFSPAGR